MTAGWGASREGKRAWGRGGKAKGLGGRTEAGMMGIGGGATNVGGFPGQSLVPRGPREMVA